jgi:addiction module RelE/StbE family toxin
LRIHWLAEARADVDAIFDFIAADNAMAAQRVFGRIGSAVGKLGAAPHIGRSGRWEGTRELIVYGTPYIVGYRVRGGAIEILRVLHAHQLWPDQPP